MNQKGLAPILIVITILAIFVAGYYLGQQKIKPTPIPSPQSTIQPSPNPADETANWKTYMNTDYGYSVRYPPAWKDLVCGPVPRFYSEDEQPPASCATDDPGDLSISVYNKTPETPLINIGSGFKVISTNLVNIGGKQGERVIVEKVEPAPGADKIVVAAVEHRGKVYTFNLQDINEQAVFDQIISTFKFTQKETSR